jgi:hypothetical protein
MRAPAPADAEEWTFKGLDYVNALASLVAKAEIEATEVRFSEGTDALGRGDIPPLRRALRPRARRRRAERRAARTSSPSGVSGDSLTVCALILLCDATFL